MKKKKQTISRTDVEPQIKRTLAFGTTTVYDWMFDIGLTTTQLLVFAYLFERLKTNCLVEHVVSTNEMCSKLGVTASRLNGITRELMKLGLVYKRVEEKKTYYSLYPNIFSTSNCGEAAANAIAKKYLLKGGKK